MFLEKVLDEKIHEYEVGRRHLAKIMGEDPENFSQEKIDVSEIDYTTSISYCQLFSIGRFKLFTSIGSARRTCSTQNESMDLFLFQSIIKTVSFYLIF